MRRKITKKDSEPKRMSPELARAIKGFRPVFGNEADRGIVERIERFMADLAKRSRDVSYQERSLVEAITARNMDF